jgi:hypothetical protein
MITCRLTINSWGLTTVICKPGILVQCSLNTHIFVYSKVQVKFPFQFRGDIIFLEKPDPERKESVLLIEIFKMSTTMNLEMKVQCGYGTSKRRE